MMFRLRFVIHIVGNVFRGLRNYYFRLAGVEIGKNTMISLGAKIDLRRGKIVIGNNCLITHGCSILSHDGAAHVINPCDDGSGRVVIGNNVFIGVNTIVLRNVSIGSNAVIGAGALVNVDIPEGSIAVGNPVKIIGSVPRPYRLLPKRH